MHRVQAGPGERVQRFLRVTGLLVDVSGRWGDLVLGELADRGAEQLVLLGWGAGRKRSFIVPPQGMSGAGDRQPGSSAPIACG